MSPGLSRPGAHVEPICISDAEGLSDLPVRKGKGGFISSTEPRMRFLWRWEFPREECTTWVQILN